MAPPMTSQAVLVRSPLLFLSSPKLRPAFQNPQALPRLRLNSSRKPTLVLASTASSSSISSSSSLPTLPPRTPKITSQSPITQTFATVAGIALFFARVIQKLSPKITEQVWLQSNLVGSVGPLFFAALNDRPRGYLNTPLTVVAAGLAKWLDIYSGVLMVRVLLSWFPNIPWDRQPLSAIRDLCDPFLNLFRNIIPPIFDTLDVSPLLAFAVLGVLGSILNSSKVVF